MANYFLNKSYTYLSLELHLEVHGNHFNDFMLITSFILFIAIEKLKLFAKKIQLRLWLSQNVHPKFSIIDQEMIKYKDMFHVLWYDILG